MKIKDASDAVNAALNNAAAKVERTKLTKWILVALAAVLLIAVGLWFSKARATGYEHGNPKGGAVSNSKAIAGAAAVAGGGAGGIGGAASSGGNSMSDGDSRAYALGLSLTTSQGDCPVLGSFNVAIIGGTYPVKLCHALQAAKLMQAVGMSKESILNAVCDVPEIAKAASECVGRK